MTRLACSPLRFIALVLLATMVALTLSTTPINAGPIEKTSEKMASLKNGDKLCKLTVKASGSEISVAESLELSIEVIEPAGLSAQLPSFNELGFATAFTERSQRFRVTNISELHTEQLADGSTLFRQSYTLEPWLSGDYAILPIMVSFNPDDAKEGSTDIKENDTVSGFSSWRPPLITLMSEGIRVKVTPLTSDRHTLSDILGQVNLDQASLLKKERRTENKSNEELRREEEEKKEISTALQERHFPWWVVWLLLAIMILLPLGWYLGRKKIKKFLAAKKIPPHEAALAALEALAKKELLKQGSSKEFYYELSFIMRRYIGGRFHISADRQTSEEFFQALLQDNPFDQKTESTLHEFTELADTVKYSLFRPDSQRGNESLKVARSFVESSKIVNEEGKK